MRRVQFQGTLDFPRAMAVDHAYDHTSGAELGGCDIEILLRTHRVGLPIPIAVEDGADCRQMMIHQKIDGLPDLPFTTLPVANETENTLVQTIQPGRQCQAIGNRQSLPQRSGSSREEGKTFRRVGMTINFAVDGPQAQRIIPGHWSPVLRVLANGQPQISRRGIDDRTGMPLRQDETIRCQMIWACRIIPHVGIHQHGYQVCQACRRRGVT